MNVEFCLAELRQMKSELGYQPQSGQGFVGGTYNVYNTADQDLHARAQVVDQILDRVVPEWRENQPQDPTSGKPKWKHHRRWVTQAIAALERQKEVDANLGSHAPAIRVDQLHAWVWDSAQVAWSAASYSDAIRAAARAINAKARQKLDRRDLSEWKLLTNAFSIKPPMPGEPRFRLMDQEDSDTFTSLHEGASALSRGLYQAVRNPMNHEDEGEEMSEHHAIECLAAFSLLARFVDDAWVVTVE